jgi:hypothetical protein
VDDTYLMLVDGKAVPVDLGAVMRRHRAAHAAARAARLTPLVDALAVRSLDVMGVCDASGLDDAQLDAGTYAALVLEQIEQGGA